MRWEMSSREKCSQKPYHAPDGNGWNGEPGFLYGMVWYTWRASCGCGRGWVEWAYLRTRGEHVSIGSLLATCSSRFLQLRIIDAMRYVRFRFRSGWSLPRIELPRIELVGKIDTRCLTHCVGPVKSICAPRRACCCFALSLLYFCLFFVCWWLQYLLSL